MKTKLILLILLLTSTTNASISLTPNVFTVDMIAGESKSKQFTVKWTGTNQAEIDIYHTVTARNTNTTGIWINLSDSNFVLNPNQKKTIDFTINTEPNLEPDIFDIIFTAKATTEVPKNKHKSSDNSNRGGGGYISAYGTRKATCFDGLLNCHDGLCEEKTDCGGPCEPCPSCFDGIQNQNEEGIDCGGACPTCITTTTTTTSITTSITTTTTPLTTTTTSMTTTTIVEDTTTTIFVSDERHMDFFANVFLFILCVLLVFSIWKKRK